MNRLWQMVNGKWQMANVGKFQAFVFCLLSFVFFITSCSTNKNASSLRSLSANHIIREVERNQFEFDNLETKFNVKVKGDNNIGLKGQLRMQNDSVIWISLSLKLGFEMARVMITEDSVKFINKTNRTYLAENINNLQERLPSEVSMDLLQNLLVGNDMQLSKNDKVKVTIENGCYKLESNATDIWVTPKTFKVKSYQLSAAPETVDGIIQHLDKLSDRTVILNYDNFQEINGKLLPTRIILNADIFDINIEIDYTEIKVGEELEFPFNISKKYNKI